MVTTTLTDTARWCVCVGWIFSVAATICLVFLAWGMADQTVADTIAGVAVSIAALTIGVTMAIAKFVVTLDTDELNVRYGILCFYRIPLWTITSLELTDNHYLGDFGGSGLCRNTPRGPALITQAGTGLVIHTISGESFHVVTAFSQQLAEELEQAIDRVATNR